MSEDIEVLIEGAKKRGGWILIDPHVPVDHTAKNAQAILDELLRVIGVYGEPVALSIILYEREA